MTQNTEFHNMVSMAILGNTIPPHITKQNPANINTIRNISKSVLAYDKNKNVLAHWNTQCCATLTSFIFCICYLSLCLPVSLCLTLYLRV